MKNIKRFMAIVMAVILSLSLVGCSGNDLADDGTQPELVQAINASGKYLTRKVTAPRYGSENVIIALNRSTYIDFWHNRTRNYVNKLEADVRNNGGYVGKKGDIHADAYPEVILAMTTSGIYANWGASQDYTLGISIDNVVMMGGYLNKVDSLIALESGNYEIAETGDLTRQDLIDFTMGLQQPDGSFSYKNMGEISVAEVTATAVTALALTEEKGNVETAVNNGVEWLVANIKASDKPEDIVETIIALNTVGVDATDVEGKDLIVALMQYARDDGSFSFDTTAKKGNVADTAIAMLGLASQYRFTQGMTSIYDLSDVLGGTHNQLSPLWMMNLKFMIFSMFVMGLMFLYIFITAKIRVRKWKKEGRYDPETNSYITDEELAAREAKLAEEAAKLAQKEEENN